MRLNERLKAVVMFPFLYYKLLVSNKRWHTGTNMTLTAHNRAADLLTALKGAFGTDQFEPAGCSFGSAIGFAKNADDALQVAGAFRAWSTLKRQGKVIVSSTREGFTGTLNIYTIA